MLKSVGILLCLAGIVATIVGVFVGQSAQHIPSNILGPYNPVTAICFYGGLVAAFVGFSIAMVAGRAVHK